MQISKLTGSFKKGYELDYTDNYFTVTECNLRRPSVYTSKDSDETSQGTFHKPKMQKKKLWINVLKRHWGVNMVLVKWVG